MSRSVSQESEPGSGRPLYSRKEKSLGVLCANFVKLYDNEGVDSIGLDDAASRLVVERRRIYDVVNILESIGVVARKQKSQYTWKGFEAIPDALKVLMEQGFAEDLSCSSTKVFKENENGSSSNANCDGQNSSASSKGDNKREKSLWLLTQNFVRLFLCSDADLITLESAARALLGGAYNSTTTRTKVRRLYDIANVLSSLNLIEKTHHPESRKPAFRWLGWRGKPINPSEAAFHLEQPWKRTFGSDITNCTSKRSKVDSSTNWKSSQKENLPVFVRSSALKDDIKEKKMKQHTMQSSKDFVFGPFGPVDIAASCDSRDGKGVGIEELENLASSYCPPYRNQALEVLFSHYVDAWRSWNVDVAGRKR